VLGKIEYPKITDIFVGDLAEVGQWVVANVRSSVAWPLSVAQVSFRDRDVFLVPRTETTYPFAAIKLQAGEHFRDGQRLLSHFLSSLSWVEGAGVTVEHWSGGSRAHPMGFGPQSGIVTSQFELDYIPDPTDGPTRWALAFYREGLGLYTRNIAYAALSFFKIINIVANNGPKQKAWMNANLQHAGETNFTKFEIAKRVTELTNAGVADIGAYLYESGRCAVAHAGANPTVDPENAEDIERLTKDLPVIRGLAACAIERELGVKSRHTIWLEHFYELAGFKELIGLSIMDRVKALDNTVTPADLAALTRISIRLHGQAPYAGLENMNVRVAQINNGVVELSTRSDDGQVEFDLALNFPTERIDFDLETGVRARDDSSERAAREIISVMQFIFDYFGNGKLQIYDPAGNLLGRKDAYLPVNIDPGRTRAHYRNLIEQYEAEAERRAAAEPGQ
jgi:hypothetical protein